MLYVFCVCTARRQSETRALLDVALSSSLKCDPMISGLELEVSLSVRRNFRLFPHHDICQWLEIRPFIDRGSRTFLLVSFAARP